jgi:minor extracellular protease Epr
MLSISTTAFGQASVTVTGNGVATAALSVTSSTYGDPVAKTIEVLVTYKNKQGKADALAIGEAVKQDSILDELNIITVRISSQDYKQLLANPNIASVDENVTISSHNTEVADLVTISNSEQVSWGVDLTQTRKAWDLGYTGKGIKIAVLDTGISEHQDLKIAGGVSTVDYTKSYADDGGHGTHVAGIIAAKRNDNGVVGVAYGADIYAVKVLDKNGNGTVASIVAGIKWSIDNKVDIINMSIGTKTYVSAIDTMLRKATDAGIIVVASAGNNGNNAGVGETMEYPANLQNVIAVVGVDKKMKRGGFSGTGKRAEVAAPGVDIVSTSIDGGYEARTGTSMATPFVTGLLAIIKQANPKKSSNEIRADLNSKGIDLGIPGRDTQYGFGFVDVTKLIPSEPVQTQPLPEQPSTQPGPTPQPTVDPNALKNATDAVKNAEKYKQYAVYIKTAVEKVQALPESPEKNELVKRLQALGAMITPGQDDNKPTTPVDPPQQVPAKPTSAELKETERYVGYAEKYKANAYIKKADELIQKLPDSPEKTAFKARMDTLKAKIEEERAPKKPTQAELNEVERYVGYAEKYKASVYIKKADELISKLPDSPEKVAFQVRIDSIKK